ncbi:hypothetical protein F4824DRAFT_501701 [Ustulina deusta]|nr:hypothetical protein F4824DRAFT_501701 [Ustulina deusta]
MRAIIDNGATYWPSADFHGTTDPTAAIALVRGYFEKYPEDAPTPSPLRDVSTPRPSTRRTGVSPHALALADEGKIKGVGPGEVD